MKKVLVLSALLITLLGCNKGSNSYKYPVDYEYGIFLGCSGKDKEKISKYHNVCVDIDEFSTSDINYLKDKECDIYAYISVGSLEKYRDYYKEFEKYTFLDYENWPDERWINISEKSWINHLISEATRFKNNGASGLFMDNFDVYYIASEVYDGGEEFKEAIYQGCLEVLNAFSELDMSLIINSGSTLLERINEENPTLLDKIDCYCQESVFSSIVDYDDNIFGKQNKEDHEYYLEMISLMKSHSDILLLEYTVDTKLQKEVVSYCKQNNCHYYISNNVDLK